MIVVVGQFRLPPDRMEAARAAMREVMQATRGEAGCVEYNYSEDLLEPGLIRVSEIWETREQLMAHLHSAHMVTWREKRQDMGMTDRSIRFYQADDGTAF